MLLKDKILQSELEKNGFIVIPFLTTDEVLDLNTFYENIHEGKEPPLFIDNIHMTTWCEDAGYKNKVSNSLATLFSKASERYFENYRRLNNVFIVKKSGEETTFKVHQDWNVVDETKYQSVNVWIPLHNVDEKSGALWVLKGSHKINRMVRGAGYLFPDYSAYTKELEKAAVSVKLKAGEAIVFYHSVIHGSPPNTSSQNRKAACFTVVPKKAPLCIYFQPDKEMDLQEYEPPDDFMFQYGKLRVEAATIPPANKAVQVSAPFINRPVALSELKLFLNPKRTLFNFWK